MTLEPVGFHPVIVYQIFGKQSSVTWIENDENSAKNNLHAQFTLNGNVNWKYFKIKNSISIFNTINGHNYFIPE